MKRNVLPLLAAVGTGDCNLGGFHYLDQITALNAALIMALYPALITGFGAVLTGELVNRR